MEVYEEMLIILKSKVVSRVWKMSEALTTSRVIEDSGREAVFLNENEKEIELVHVFRPLGRLYGNRVETHIWVNKEERTLNIVTLRFDWNGTGPSRNDSIKLSDEEVKRLSEAMRSMKTLSDFEKLEEAIDDMIKAREEAVKEVVDELLNKIDELVIADEKLKYAKVLLNNKEKLKELLEEEIESVANY